MVLLCAARITKAGRILNKKRLDSWKAIAAFLDRSLRTVQRWHVCNGLPVHRFGGQTGSVFAYEEEIEHWLANLAEESGALQQRAEVVLEAGKRRSRELTATANNMWDTRSEGNIQTIAELYRRAIADDSTNTIAYAGLAKAMVFCAMNDVMDSTIAYPCAVEALQRAPQLDCMRVDAKCPAAWIDMLYYRNWQSARTGFEEAVNQRRSSFSLAGLAAIDIAEDHGPRAQSRAWEAWRLNPLVSSLGAFLCWTVYLNGQFHQALDLATQIRSGGGDGGFLTAVEALALIQAGPASTTLNRIERAASNFPLNHTLQGILGYAYGASGNKSEAAKTYERLARSAEMNGKSNGYGLAIASMGLGNHRGALGWLETAYAEGSLWSLAFRSDPMLKSFRGDPRFEQLAGKIGSPTRHQAEASLLGLPSQTLSDRVMAGKHP